MTLKTGIMRFARNKKQTKNGLNPFGASTKTSSKRAKTIMPIRYKNRVLAINNKENGLFFFYFFTLID